MWHNVTIKAHGTDNNELDVVGIDCEVSIGKAPDLYEVMPQPPYGGKGRWTIEVYHKKK